jgi:hypothetical protein
MSNGDTIVNVEFEFLQEIVKAFVSFCPYLDHNSLFGSNKISC